MFWNRKEYTKQNIYFKKENCPFCDYKNKFQKYFVFESKYWTVAYNIYPYYWNKQNLLVFPKKHRKFCYELNQEELKDYKNIEIFLKRYFKDKEYFSIIRQSEKWRSVEHLHYHYLQWEIHWDKKDPYRFNVLI